MQAVNMGNHFRFCGPSTEIEAQHLIHALRRGASDPQADQQASDKGGVHLQAHPIEPLAQQMPAAQDTFDPAEKQLNGMITNDKFCCTRWSQLQLSWWRRPLRLRS